MKNTRVILSLVVIFFFVLQINAVKTPPGFLIKKVVPAKIQLEKGGEEVLIEVLGRKLFKVEDAEVLKLRGKKFLKSRIITSIIKKRSSSNRLVVKIRAGENVNLGKNYILRLFEKKVRKKAPFMSVSQKLLKIVVVSPIKKKTASLKAPATSGKTLKSTKIPLTVKKTFQPAKVPVIPLDHRIYSFSKKELQIKNDNKPGIIVVNGRDLEKVTSAQLILNNRVVKNIKVELGVKKVNSREIKFTALPGAIIGKNYRLRLLFGSRKIDIPENKFFIMTNKALTSFPNTALKRKQLKTKPSATSIQTLKPVIKKTTTTKKIAEVGFKQIEALTKKPDLKFTKLELLVLNPGDLSFAAGRTIYTHSKVRIRITFVNAGNASVDIYDMNWGVVEGPIKKNKWIDLHVVLESNEERTGVLNYFGPLELEAGSYSVDVMIDSKNKIAESSENNNVLKKQFTINPSNLYSGLPDLRFVSVDTKLLTDESCGGKREYSFDVKVINSGTFPAHVHGNEVIDVNMWPLTTNYNEGINIVLDPNNTRTVQFKGLFKPGTSHTFTFETDKNENVPESNENNNSYTVNLTVPNISSIVQGDLIISNAYIRYTQSNQLYWLEVEIKNIGSKPVTLCPGEPIWTTTEYPAGLSWTGSNTNDYVVLNPGDKYITPTHAHRVMPEGEYNFTLKVDYKYYHAETNEANNTYSFTVKVPEDVILE